MITADPILPLRQTQTLRGLKARVHTGESRIVVGRPTAHGARRRPLPDQVLARCNRCETGRTWVDRAAAELIPVCTCAACVRAYQPPAWMNQPWEVLP
jgi:hypothetical protein